MEGEKHGRKCLWRASVKRLRLGMQGESLATVPMSCGVEMCDPKLLDRNIDKGIIVNENSTKIQNEKYTKKIAASE